MQTKHPEMNPALQEQCEAIGELLLQSTTNAALQTYEIGQRVAWVMSHEAKYGKRAVLQLARALGKKQGWLYDAAKVANTWPKPEFRKLLKRTNCFGVPLTFSHFVELVSVGKRREKWINKCLDEGLSIRQLRRALLGAPPPIDSDNHLVQKTSRQAQRLATLLDEFEAIDKLPEESGDFCLEDLRVLGERLDSLLRRHPPKVTTPRLTPNGQIWGIHQEIIAA